MKIIGNLAIHAMHKFGFFLFDEIKELGRVENLVGPAQNIGIPVSGQTNITIAGRKCEHGVYIPSNSFDSNRAEFCTSCRPVVIETRTDA